MDLTLRPLGTDDIPLLAAHLAAVEAVDATGEHYSEEDLVEEFANPDIEVGKDIVGVFDPSTGSGGTREDLVGYFAVYPRSTDDVFQKVHLEGSVNPVRRGQGIGTCLVEAMLARADDVLADLDVGVGELLDEVLLAVVLAGRVDRLDRRQVRGQERDVVGAQRAQGEVHRASVGRAVGPVQPVSRARP